MAVQFRLKEKMAEKERLTGQRVTYRGVSGETGVALSTLWKIGSNRQTMVSLSVLDRLCRFFGCQVGDLLVHVPDNGAAAQ